MRRGTWGRALPPDRVPDFERIGIGERTAKFHVYAIFAKLGAETRTEAVVIAARLGPITL